MLLTVGILVGVAVVLAGWRLVAWQIARDKQEIAEANALRERCRAESEALEEQMAAHLSSARAALLGQVSVRLKLTPEELYARIEEHSSGDALDQALPSLDSVHEQAYLVARGVRPLAIVAYVTATPQMIARARCLITSTFVDGALPFVVDSGDGLAMCGYSSTAWAVELLRWASSAEHAAPHKHHIIGLLLGYSAFAIRDHHERSAVVDAH